MQSQSYGDQGSRKLQPLALGLAMQSKIDEAAIMWNKTKDPKYKKLWYKLIRKWCDGSNNIERWNVSVSSINKADDGTYVIIGKRN